VTSFLRSVTSSAAWCNDDQEMLQMQTFGWKSVHAFFFVFHF
jgi:hypothetical protein